MVIPFNKQQQIHGRYQLLTPQPVIKQLQHDADDTSKYDGTQYATFIRSLGTNEVKPQERLSRPKAKPSVLKQSETSNNSRTGKKTPEPSYIKGTQSAPPSVYKSLKTINQIKVKNEETHQKKMKAIEDYMFHCKQQERELKRVEGDVLKEERNLKKAMKEYEKEIYDDQRQQEAMLSLATKDEDLIKKDYYKEDTKIMKDNINRNLNNIQKEREEESKSIDNLNGLEFRFENIAEAINLKRMEVNSLVKEFERKVRQKEEEEYRLKKEFANISLELRMTAQKQKVQTENIKKNNLKSNEANQNEQKRRNENFQDQLTWQKNLAGQAERSRRRLSKDLHETTSKMSMHEREDGRRLMDVRAQLNTNALKQKEAKIKAELLEMERKGILSDEKIMAVNARRKAIQDMLTQQRKQKNDQSMDEWKQRNLVVNHEMKKHDLEDSISHFQKTVAKQEELEHSLYIQVKLLEADRKKQEQIVERLKEELYESQRMNKALLRETALRCKEQESELQQRLQKEEAQLGKALSEREERIQTLIKCRDSSKEEKHMLEEEKKVRDRLIRIEKKSDLLREEQYEKAY